MSTVRNGSLCPSINTAAVSMDSPTFCVSHGSDATIKRVNVAPHHRDLFGYQTEVWIAKMLPEVLTSENITKINLLYERHKGEICMWLTFLWEQFCSVLDFTSPFTYTQLHMHIKYIKWWFIILYWHTFSVTFRASDQPSARRTRPKAHTDPASASPWLLRLQATPDPHEDIRWCALCLPGHYKHGHQTAFEGI